MEEKIDGITLLVGTAECNANCPQCAGRQHRKNAPQKDGELDAAQLVQVLGDCHDRGCSYVTLNSSGEPTLSPLSVTGVLKIIDEYGWRGKRFKPVNLYTNGIRIGRDAEFCGIYLPLWRDLGLTSVYVSVYSADEDLNAGAFGVEEYPSFETVFSRIKEWGLTLRASLILKKGYTDTLEKFEALCEKFFGLGVDNISAWPLKDEHDFISDLAPPASELGRMQEFVESDPPLLRWYAGREIRLLLGDSDSQEKLGKKVALFQNGEISDVWCARK